MNLKIELDETVWAKVIDMLATQPFKDVAPIIANLSQQFQQQQQQKQN